MLPIKISIIVPVYNAAKFLPRCLDSILKQSYKNLEIICVNDGSQDESLSILHIYEQKDPRIRIVNQFNQGAAAARNKGLKVATGDYISFIDADDYISDGLYEYFVQAIEQDRVDIFMFNGQINQNGLFFTENNFYHPVAECQNVTYKDFYGLFYGNSGVYNKIFKASFLQESKISFLSQNCFEDIDFWFRSLILAQKVKISFKTFYHYCFDNENSVTKTLGANALSLFDTFSSMMKAAKDQGLLSFFNEAFLQFQYEKITETLSLIAPEYQERLYERAQKFLTQRCREMEGSRFQQLMNFGICYNIITNKFIDFQNTTLLFRTPFKYMAQKPQNLKFSIIVPVYNVETYVGTCLKSLINQTFPDFEIICINDGSTDRSLEVLQYHAAKDARIKIINQENKGLGAARNIGTEQAKGEYLIFVDSDDWIRTDTLEILNRQLNENPTDVCLFGYSNFIDDLQCNVSVSFLDSLKRKELKYPYDYMFLNVTAWGKTYSRQFWQQHNLHFAEKVFFEDNITNVQVFSYAQTCNTCQHNFYYYRVRNNSITQARFSDKKIEDLFASLTGMLAELKKQSFFPNIKFRFQTFCHNCLEAHSRLIPPEQKERYLSQAEKFLTQI